MPANVFEKRIVTILVFFFIGVLVFSSLNIYSHLSFLGKEVLPLEDSPKVSLNAYVSGAVINPGVYQISPNTITMDVVTMAGGFDPGVDSDYVAQKLNLSKRVFNEDHIFIPFEKVSNIDSLPKGNTSSGLIGINTASVEELDTLPGIGPVTAEKIVAQRPYSSIEDLKNVSGIGDATFLKFKDLISID